jgi:alpha-D-ribose 1-methylphosphonate 5-triphosphate synthase subunit PhnH
MSLDVLSGGFTDAPVQSASAFRQVMQAMARPGSIHRVTGATPPVPVSVAAGVALLVLADGTTPLHLAGALDTPALRHWIAFHIGSPLVPAEDAALALGRWEDLQPVTRFSPGLPDYPDRSATLIVERDTLTPHGACLTGPGIETATWLNLPETAAFRVNRARFPLGFDTIFTAGDRLAALPRSTKVEAL